MSRFVVYSVADAGGLVVFETQREGRFVSIWRSQVLAVQFLAEAPGGRVVGVTLNEVVDFLDRSRREGVIQVWLERGVESAEWLCGRAPIESALILLRQMQEIERLGGDIETHIAMMRAKEDAGLRTVWQDTLCGVYEDAPEEWKTLNIESEKHVIRALRSEALFHDPLLIGYSDRMAISHYRYFIAFSGRLSDAIVGERCCFHRYLAAFCGLTVQKYLRACAAMYCAKHVATYRDDHPRGLMLLYSTTVMCGLPFSYQLQWAQCWDHQAEKERFNSALSVRLYSEMADVLGLPTDAAALARAATYSEWNGMAMVVSQSHNETGQDSGFAEYCGRILNLSSTPDGAP